MAKKIISKRDLDALISAHLAYTSIDCDGVVPMPVIWRARGQSVCNWTVPGWSGDSRTVQRCAQRLHLHLRELKTAYDIPEEH